MQKTNAIKITCLCVFFLSFIKVNAQIINAESLRMVNDTIGWSGNVGLDLGYSKSVATLFRIKNKVHVQYKKEKHLLMFINKIGFESANNADFVNKGVQHLRYNYRFNKKISWEIFLQNQYNAISKIAYRELAGSGLRYKLSSSEKYKLYLGSLLMYEFEKTLETPHVFHKDWRNSSYLTFSLYFNKNISLISTTYFQPKLVQFSDYRMSHQSAFSFKIIKNLAFKTSFNYSYDSFPVIGVPKQEFDISNGLVYRFN